MRSAAAPATTAGVMIANINWNMRNAESGTGRRNTAFSIPIPRSPTSERSPMKPPTSPENASEAPTPTQSSVTTPIAM